MDLDVVGRFFARHFQRGEDGRIRFELAGRYRRASAAPALGASLLWRGRRCGGGEQRRPQAAGCGFGRRRLDSWIDYPNSSLRVGRADAGEEQRNCQAG